MIIIWTRPAVEDLQNIYDYIAKDNSAASTKMAKLIYDRVNLLKTHPGIGRPGRWPATRELTVTGTPFIVPYRVRGNNIEILAVFHGARLWPERKDYA